METAETLLVTVGGRDAPGIAATLFGALDRLGLAVLDVEQIGVHGRLLLCVEVTGPGPGHAAADVERAVDRALGLAGVGPGRSGAGTDGPDLTVNVELLGRGGRASRAKPGPGHLVTVVAPELTATALAGIFGQVTAAGGNVDRVVRLADYPVVSYELAVSGADPVLLRRELAAEAAALQVDLAVQQAGLHRRAKHLIVLDVDSTLLQGEVIDLLAEYTDHGDEVARITAEAMTGGLDFEAALRRRVALLAGLGPEVLGAVRERLRLTPGARTLVRTLQRLGYETAIVSGGFTNLIDELAAELGIDHVAANVLEVEDGVLTGRLAGPVVDRAGKAAALVRFATETGVPLSRTIAVGDGANDLDMLAVAGLGIAFNAKPVVRQAADTALSVPYLDAILFLLGIARHEIEAADRDLATPPARPGIPVPQAAPLTVTTAAPGS